MTRLREMMLEELQRRNYSAITTCNYLWVAWPSPIIDCWPSTRSASPFAGRITPTAASKAR